jgi:hypothetical protein
MGTPPAEDELEWVESGIPIGDGRMGEISSALVFLIVEKKWNCHSETVDKINRYRGAHKRKMTKKKVEAGQGTETGKRPFTLEGLKVLCRRAMREDVLDNRSFVWLFILLAWNLCARNQNVATLRYNHLAMRDDGLRVVFMETKTMHDGKAEHTPFHIFANPKNPEICSFLAFGVFILTRDVTTNADGGDLLFSR